MVDCVNVLANNPNDDVEQHVILDWLRACTSDDMNKVLKQFTSLRLHFESPVYAIEEQVRRKVVSQLYDMADDGNGGQIEADIRGSKDFAIYLLNDTKPEYGYRTTESGLRIVNTNMFDMKEFIVRSIQMRKLEHESGDDEKDSQKESFGHHGLLHASYNIQETKNVLRTLNLYEALYRQRRFNSLIDIFDTLNAAGSESTSVSASPPFYYLIMRNFELLPDQVEVDEHLDVDMLVSDYYTAKRLLDAETAVHHNIMHTQTVDFGGWRILNYVEIEGIKILFDVRHIGDNYYDERFQRTMLATRQRRHYEIVGLDGSTSNHHFYIPEHTAWIFSLVYHAVVHKVQMSETYKHHFSTHGLLGWEWKNFPELWTGNREVEARRMLWQKLQSYMHQHNYRFTRANDLTVGYFLITDILDIWYD